MKRFSIASMMGVVLVAALALGAVRSPVIRVILIPSSVAAAVAVILLKRGKARVTFGRTLGFVVATMIGPVVGAALISQAIWGYPFERPGLDRRIREATAVQSVTLVNSAKYGPGPGPHLVGRPLRSLSETFGYGRVESYYVLEARVLVYLDRRGLLPKPTVDDLGIIVKTPDILPRSDLDRLRALLEKSGRIEKGDPGYEDQASSLRGVVIEASGADGRALLFVGLRGGEVSNDHHPYYEFLYEWTEQTAQPRLLSFQRFYFDVAGIEGIEFPAFFLPLSLVALVVATVAGSLAVLVRRRKLAEREHRDRLYGTQ